MWILTLSRFFVQVIEHLARKGQGNVFATDTIVAHIMASPRSVFPWDLTIQKIHGSIFINKRDESALLGNLDYLTVGETAYSPPTNDAKEAINTAEKLSIEATAINQCFSQQVLLHDQKKSFDNPNPFFDPEDHDDSTEPAAVAYKYRKWKLSKDITLVARCELHGVVKREGSSDQYMTCCALNQYDYKLSDSLDWKTKLDSQRGAVLATELKNNAAKLAKWTAQAILAGADVMKVGYVSRLKKKDNTAHTILGTQFYKPKAFARQITLHESNMWGIFKLLVEICMKQEDGKFVLLKHPNKQQLILYNTNTAAEDSSSGESDDSSGSDDSDSDSQEE